MAILQVQDGTAAATGTTARTFRNILDPEKSAKLKNETRNKFKKKSRHLEENIKPEVRNTIYKMYENKEYVTLENLLSRLLERYTAVERDCYP